ncbi:hypothetical protein TRFO_11092 [Tritrichomonas foetus]|uniref:Trafficking protein particle complex subunit n=1 Tax=Tritrichomonas foetus TaxID=1144522 RepID=A0A1J4JAK6_9EUKA|nr:hypothetical protein TRFO_11092 [Tritrichomonas foetus]|eukprot:OHS94477.1 hypothetical protein TRFO_11092 [Tritrichomonas foetus]
MNSPNSTAVDFSALIYGSLVNSLLEMTEDVNEVNTKLDEIGYRIGLRLAHEFARDKNLDRVDSPEKLIKDVLIKNWPIIAGKTTSAFYKVIDNNTFMMAFQPSTFTEYVTIPELYSGVQYTAMLPGALRGIFEIFHYEAEVSLEPPQVEQKAGSQKKPPTEVKIVISKVIPVAVPKDED